MKTAYIFDLDGTLADNMPRVQLYLLDREEADWDSFYDHCEEDYWIISVCAIAVALWAYVEISASIGMLEAATKQNLRKIQELKNATLGGKK